MRREEYELKKNHIRNIQKIKTFIINSGYKYIHKTINVFNYYKLHITLEIYKII